MKTFDVGTRRYDLVEGWGTLPEGWIWGQVAGVAADSEDNVHVFTRNEHPYMIFDKSGKLIDHWGEGIFGMAHGVCITPDDSVYFVEHESSVILKFDKSGRHRLTMGTRDTPSDTGFKVAGREPDRQGDTSDIEEEADPAINSVAYSGGPFNFPTDLGVAPDGGIFVSDGYRNARVHKFGSDGALIKSWGEPGNARQLRHTKDAPGYFHTPHGIWVHKSRVYVSDRDNYRIQIFTLEGEFVDMWTGFHLPTKIYVDPTEEVMYVSELHDRVSIVDLEGNVIGRLGDGQSLGGSDGGQSRQPTTFWGPHGIWTDSESSIYVGEVLEEGRVQKFSRRS